MLHLLECKSLTTKPIPSMYGIFTYIWLIFMINVGKYTIHGWYGKIWACWRHTPLPGGLAGEKAQFGGEEPKELDRPGMAEGFNDLGWRGRCVFGDVCVKVDTRQVISYRYIYICNSDYIYILWLFVRLVAWRQTGTETCGKKFYHDA